MMRRARVGARVATSRRLSCCELLFAVLRPAPRRHHHVDEIEEGDPGEGPAPRVVPEAEALGHPQGEAADHDRKHHRERQQHLPGDVHELVDPEARQRPAQPHVHEHEAPGLEDQPDRPEPDRAGRTRPLCALTISCNDRLPTISPTASRLITAGISSETICAAERIAPKRAYLLLLAQPAMMRRTVERLETATT